MKKPTGRMGADDKDRINRCIAIERRILDKTSSGILGASSEEDVNSLLLPSSSGDEESNEESKEEVVPGMEVQPHHIDFSQPPALPPFSFTNDNSTQPNEPTDDTIANDNTAKTSTSADVFANGQAADATQVAGRNTASLTVSRAGEQSTTPISAAARMRPTQLVVTKKKPRKSDKTNKTKNSSNSERGSVTKSIERIASSINEGRGAELQTFMMMRKMEWDEAEERRRQEREEAMREREEARRERDEMEERRDRRLGRQFNQQNQMMQNDDDDNDGWWIKR
jgi:hypothetical protein